MPFSKFLYTTGTLAIAILLHAAPHNAAAQGITDPQDQFSPYADAPTPNPQFKDYSAPPPIPSHLLEAPQRLTSKNDGAQSGSTKAPPSRIESLYAARTGENLTQFGYDFFGTGAFDKNETPQNMPMGAVQDDFVLNIGDTLSVTFSGQNNAQMDATIDNQGMLLLKDLPPIAAAGLNIVQIRARLDAAANHLHNTQIFVSLASVRQIGILMIGNVKKPGRYNLTVFNTITEALDAAGGIRKDGSLRAVKLIRGGNSEIIDLYALLMHGAPAADLRLRDGDRIIVPPVGQTVAVSGAFKQPAIFELPHAPANTRQNAVTLDELLAYAGGILPSGHYRLLKLGMKKDGRETTEEITRGYAPSFYDGDILMALREEERRADMVELTGHTRKSGLHDVKKHAKLSTLLRDENALGDDTYPLIGLIERYEPQTLSTRFISFSIRSVLNKSSDHDLHNNDKVYIFSNQEIETIFNDKNNETTNIEKQKNINKIDPKISSILREKTVTLHGGVRAPGRYPIADDTTLESLIATAGGLIRGADTNAIEITSKTQDSTAPAHENRPLTRSFFNLAQTHPAQILLYAGDSVRININARQIEEKSVILSGEVNSPGKYNIMPGDKISHLIERAGGLTRDAYPAGAIFSRESERRAEEARYRAAAQELEHSLASAMQKDTKAPDTAQIEMIRGLARELTSAKGLGRITIEADPAMLATNPDLDMLLEEGDRLFIPKRPLTVRVSGEVLSPASLQFRKDKDPITYIREAGDFTFHADKGRSFVLYPNGSAQPLKVSRWNHTPILIPPGSTIVVPRDPKPFDFIETARDFTQILSNLAVTAIFVDDLRD